MVNTLLTKMGNEDEKVRLVQRRNNQLIISLIKVIGVLFTALLIGSIPFIIYLFSQSLTVESLDFSSLSAIASLTVGSTLGFYLPIKKKSNKESYSELSQLLHRLALNNYAIAYWLFKIEVKRLKKRNIELEKKFLVVSGLARSGTTSLMNSLTKHHSFSSLGYANMPFLTAPNIWSKFYKPKTGEEKERSHNDGIMIGLDSFEALEEYFLKVIANDSYVLEEYLSEYALEEEQKNEYLTYQAIVRKQADSIYLAKNNNLLLRYNSLRESNRDFVAVFMFRDPLTHASSLLEKHKHYTLSQEEDGFVLEYMNWLGHHEFGLNQKPFQFDQEFEIQSKDKNTLDYWLEIWINYYGYLLTIEKLNTLFVDYDEYCENPESVTTEVLSLLKLDVVPKSMSSFVNKRKVKEYYTEEIFAKATSIHRKLKRFQP